ncbi:hypothetical protein BDB01DRAFT_883532 [Pilobolus umbonatus]|nr:hypothetical protein BDB01DRAFT_883532 [Pilobolus umbonatus]
MANRGDSYGVPMEDDYGNKSRTIFSWCTLNWRSHSIELDKICVSSYTTKNTWCISNVNIYLMTMSTTTVEELPAELIMSIFQYLNRTDIMHCLTVSSTWSNYCMSIIYRDININNYKILMSFLQSMNQHLRCMEAGKYIRKLGLCCDINWGTKDSFQMKRFIVNALIRSPNIERLILDAPNEFTTAFVDYRMPRLTKLKYLDIRRCYNGKPVRILELYTKYCKQITTLNLPNCYIYMKDPKCLPRYLSQFTLLTELYIGALQAGIDDRLLDEILAICPQLSVLRFPSSLFYGLINNIEYRYEPLVELQLEVELLTVHHIVYIKTRFPNIKKLRIDLSIAILARDVLAMIMEMDFLDEIQINVFPASNEGNRFFTIMLRTFWDNIPRIQHDIKKASFECGEDFQTDVRLSISKCVLTGQKIVHSRVRIGYDEVISYWDFLDYIGGSLDELEITDLSYESEVEIARINQLCPQLTELYFQCEMIEEFGYSIRPNYNLKKLTIEGCNLDYHAFDEIKFSYPEMQHLSLICTRLDNFGEEYFIHLPKRLVKFNMVWEESEDIEMNYGVIRETESDVCVWHYRSVTNSVGVALYKGVSRKKNIDEFYEKIEIPCKPYKVLTSTTLKEVTMGKV